MAEYEKRNIREKYGEDLIFSLELIWLTIYVGFEGKQKCLEYNINSTVNTMQFIIFVKQPTNI